jgi:hypothetical protein
MLMLCGRLTDETHSATQRSAGGDDEMKGFISPLTRRNRPGYREAVERIETIVRATLALPDDIVVSMAELACREPECPDTETVIAILPAGRDPVTVRILAAIPQVAEADLIHALLSLDRDQLQAMA